MNSDIIIGLLAIFTIGGTLGLAIFHFGFHLKDPKNLAAAKQVAADRQSATTKVSSEGAQGRTLRERLDSAPGVNDRLGTDGNMTPLDALTTNWSNVRKTLNNAT